MIRRAGLAFLVAALAALPDAAAAHAIAERYDLPVPLGFYVAGAAAVVAFTFVLMAVFIYAAPGPHRRHGIVLAVGETGPPAWTALVLRALSVLALALVVVAGLFGTSHPARNVAPTLVWIVWWIGFGFLAAFLVDPWPLLNPWKNLFAGLEAAWRRLTGRALASHCPFPPWLAEWPAVALLFAFVWIEVVYPDAAVPRSIAIFAIAYTAIAAVGMTVYGREAWLRHGEAFTIVFAVLGRFAPVGRDKSGRLVLRPYASGLLEAAVPSTAVVAFVQLMLATVLFDGFLGTALWRRTERAWYAALPFGMDRDGLAIGTLGLLGLWLVFLGAYFSACIAMRRVVAGRLSARDLARRFALTLVPIAIGYHVAHNFSYLVVQGQMMWGLASDPLGLGWNLFGTSGYQPAIGVLEARTVWYIAVISIVVGHLVSLYLAHVIALELFVDRWLAVRALCSMTVLMVAYTGVSLSILAEPLVRFSVPDPTYSQGPPAPDGLHVGVSVSSGRGEASPTDVRG